MAQAIRTSARSARRVTSFQSLAFQPSHKRGVAFLIKGEGQGVSQNVAIPDSPHTFRTDTYPAFGGADSAPSPLHFNLSALSSCTQVTGSIVAKDQGIKLGEWRISITGELDPAVLVQGKQGNANWTGLKIQIEVDADAEGSDFAHFASEVERRCPVTQLFKRSGVQYDSKWVNARR